MTDLRKAAEMALEALETLWDILDDIDTASDMAKENDAWYRKRVEALQKKRWDTMITTDGYKLKDGPVEALRQALAQPEQEQKTPLKVLNLTVFTENRLRNGRVYDVETLQAMTSRDILAIPDIGKKALKEVMEALDVYAVNMSQERVDETAKCKREWVWLTDDEMFNALLSIDAETKRLPTGLKQFAKAIETKLKEKNT